MFCHLWGNYLCPLNIFNIFEEEKKLMIFLWFWVIIVEFFHDFGWFFLYPFPDPFHETDLDICLYIWFSQWERC